MLDNSKKNKKRTLFILTFFLLIAIGAGFYFWQIRGQFQNVASISIISPSAQDVWAMGSTHVISWNTKNIPSENKISITIRRIPPPPLPLDGQEFDPILFINLPDTGSVNWTIPTAYPAGTYIIAVNSYKKVPITNVIAVESQPFKIQPLPLSQDIYPLYNSDSINWSAPHTYSLEVPNGGIFGSAVDATVATGTMNPSKFFSPFDKYYKNKLTALGWKVDNSLLANGPASGQVVYRKGDAVIAVNFLTIFHDISNTRPEQCPCDVDLSLFSSNFSSSSPILTAPNLSQ